MSKYTNVDKIVITNKENITKIEILEDCSLAYFFDVIKNKLPKSKINQIKMDSIYNPNKNINSDDKITKKTLYIIEIDNKVYNIATKIKPCCGIFLPISSNYDNTYISERVFNNNEIDETVLELLSNGNYTVSKMIHDKNGNSKSVTTYKKITEIQIPDPLRLNKKKALLAVRNLLSNLEKMDNIDSLFPIDLIYRYLNIISEKDYFPVIKDDTLALSWKYNNEKDINKQMSEGFAIVLNKTKEVVGDISFDYQRKAGFQYEGNISYSIHKEHRHKHFGTRALKLLKELLQNNEFTGDKDLYIAAKPDNKYSQQVAINNGATLIYDGEVPEKESINYIDGIKNVKVYKISMNNYTKTKIH